MIQRFCGYTGLVNFVFCFSFAILLLLKNPRNRVNRTFSFWSVCVAFWSLGYFPWLLFSETADQALFWTRFLMAGAIVIPASFLHFTFSYLGIDKAKGNRAIIFFLYFFAIVYLGLNFTPLFIQKVEPRFWFEWWPVPGHLYHIYQIYFLAVVLYTHILFFRAAFRSQGIERKQLMFVAIGTAIAYLGGSTNFFIWYNIPIPPVLNFLVLGYVALIFYAVLNYRLWEIELVVKNTVIFAGIFLFAFLLFLLTDVLQNTMPASVAVNLLVFAIGALIVTLVIERLRKFLVNITDKFLFQELLDYQRALKMAGKGIAQIKSLNHLLRLIVHFITLRTRIKSAGVFMWDDDEHAYILKKYRHCKSSAPIITRLESDHPIVAYLKQERRKSNLEFHVVCELARRAKSEEDYFRYNFDQIRKTMEKMSAHLIIASYFQDKLLGFLILGEKFSQDAYHQGDVALFTTIAQESAIAFENARKHDELVKKSEELQAVNTELEKAQSAMIAMEAERAVGDVGVGIGHDLQNSALMINEAALNLKKVVTNFSDFVLETYSLLKAVIPPPPFDRKQHFAEDEKSIVQLTEIISQCSEQMSGVAETLLNMGRGEKATICRIVLSTFMKWASRLGDWRSYSQQMRGATGNLAPEVHVPPELPAIKANPYLLKSVFTNLFKNAYEALNGAPMKKIVITAEKNPNNKQMVIVKFSDTGCGISNELLPKIFKEHVSTKGEKGHGQGLVDVKRNIDEMHGSIAVESEEGMGTTFIIQLPIATLDDDL